MTSAPGRRTRLLLAALLLAGLGLRLVFSQISLERLPVSADEAMVVLQAKQIARGDRPLLFMAQPYQFPLGAYLMAPLVQALPRTALGARGPTLSLGLLGFLGLWLLAARQGPAARTWPGLLLVAFPSSYLLMYQAAYPVPQYDLMLALWLLTAWLCLLMDGRPARSALGLAVLVGLAAGLALSVHLLALSLVAPLVLAACLCGGLRKAPARAGAIGLGLTVGLLPFLLALWVHPGAAGQVAGLRPWEAILRSDKLEVLNHAVAGVLGAFSCAFPDLEYEVSLGGWAEYLFPAGYAALLLACGVISLRALFQGRKDPATTAQPAPVYQAAVAAAPWLGLALFLVNERANAGQYRYLLVLAWCLPFLLMQVYGAAGRRIRVALGVVAVGLAAFNLLTSLTLMGVWRQPDFAKQNAILADLAPVEAYLGRHGITRCFAAYWTAYRITFDSDEKIICSQPLNERFPDWPIPYKDQVLRSSKAAYVLTSPDSFDAHVFERDLEAGGVACLKVEVGSYRVYADFRSKDKAARVPPGEISVRASHQPGLVANLNDGNAATRWTTDLPQQAGMWLELRLERPLPLTRLTMLYHRGLHDFPQGLRLLHRQGDQWRVLEDDTSAAPHGFVFRDNLPVYGESTQELRFPATLTDALRLEITRPNADPNRYWSISGLELYFDSQADAGRTPGRAAEPKQASGRD